MKKKNFLKIAGFYGILFFRRGEVKNLMKKYIHSNKEVSLDGVSDCEVIAHLFNKFNNHKHYTLHDIPSMLDGQFAFVAVKNNEDKILIARDPLGVAPLYYGYDDRKNLWVSSELKAINKLVTLPKEFPPGHCLTSTREEDMFRYYNPRWWNGVLAECNFKERYTLYSLRSTHITHALLKGMNVRIVAENCGTSQNEIETTYQRLNNLLNIDQLGFFKDNVVETFVDEG